MLKQIKKMKGKLNKLHRKDLVNDFQAEFKEEPKDMFKIKECCPEELSAAGHPAFQLYSCMYPFLKISPNANSKSANNM